MPDLGDIAERADRALTNLEGLADDLAEARNRREPHLSAKAQAVLFEGSGRRSSDGRYLRGIMLARSHDHAEQSAGKAELADLGVTFHEADPNAKATLGTTDATGGWLLPNASVDDLVKPAEYGNLYRNLMTVRTGIRTLSVDMPFRAAAPARAVIAVPGDTKENVDLVYNGYAATMYTLARITDLSVRFVRYSAGAAEKDVMTELGNALGRGEAYYIRDGTGSSQPFGFIPALTNGPATFRSTFSPATTLAGSISAAIGTAAGALMARGRRPEAAVISATAYTQLMLQGTDTAGFFLNGVSPGGQAIPGFRPGTLVSQWGIPVVVDTDFADDDLVVAEWSAFRIYIGDGPRIDTSTEAGTRWDANLVGFRGEEDFAYDARPAVYAGAAQMITDILP
jgi:HK97 family phage major capsid protein